MFKTKNNEETIKEEPYYIKVYFSDRPNEEFFGFVTPRLGDFINIKDITDSNKHKTVLLKDTYVTRMDMWY